MTHDQAIFVPATPYDESKEKGRFSRFDPGARTLPAGFRVGEPYTPLPVDIVFEKDVAVPLRDGVTIYVDVFRPAGDAPVPVIVAWSPYGKSRGGIPSVTAVRSRLGIDQRRLSGLMKFEGPDPAFWCTRGYAVCNPDARGAFNSGGDIHLWGRQEGQDGHDLVEWLAEQDWCTGKVGLSGNSYLAISQWFIAAEQPPHLAAVAPWEGLSDFYRDNIARGGIPDAGMAEQLKKLNFTGHQRMEDPVTEIESHPLFDDLWADKAARLEQITVPAYVVASYTNTIHSPGTFRAWRRIASPQKWLRIHNTMEWVGYYSQESLDDLARFFDHFLKGVDNGWEHTSRVRYALVDFAGHNLVNLPDDQFPPIGVEQTTFHLDAASGQLTRQAPTAGATATYDATSKKGRAEFTTRFDEETHVVGYPKVRLWVEADGADDMDLFVFLQKLDANGKQLQELTVTTRSPLIKVATSRGASVLKNTGASGRLRVSMRHLDEDASTDEIPVQSFDRAEKLAAGQVVEVEIALFPVGWILHPGEQLRLVVTGQNLAGAPMMGVRDVTPDNHGRHVVHTGGQHDSFLQVPIRVVAGHGAPV